MKATPEIKKKIIEMKLAKACSTDIAEAVGVGCGIIEATWVAYRKANPNAPAVGTGTHSHRRISKP